MLSVRSANAGHCFSVGAGILETQAFLSQQGPDVMMQM